MKKKNRNVFDNLKDLNPLKKEGEIILPVSKDTATEPSQGIEVNIGCKISVTVSSQKDNCSPSNVLHNSESEWISDGDHKDAWIKLLFPEQKVTSVSFADRRASDASMVAGTLAFFLNEIVVSEMAIEVNGSGDTKKIELDHAIVCDSVMIQASEKGWGANLGLRYFNFNQK